MHEVSLMTNILEIASEEMQKHVATKLKSLTVRYGSLTNIVADSMHFAFEALTKNTSLEGANLILQEENVSIKCHTCGHSCTVQGKEYLYMPCPSCNKQTSFEVTGGDGIFLDRLEAE